MATVERRRMRESELQELHAADASLFPSALPYEVLLSLYRAVPDDDSFSILQIGGVDVGSLVVLPLHRAAWTALTTGSLAESCLSTMHLRPVGGERSLHVWHVEAWPAWRQQTDMRISRYLADLFATWRRQQREMGVTRLSALTASRDGARLFARLGFQPVGEFDHVCTTATGSRRWVEHVASGRREEVLQSLGPGEEIVNACVMMVWGFGDMSL